jgi:proline iminopeptidase
LVFLIAALAAALLAPYFLAALSANTFLLTVISVASFGLLLWIGVKAASAIAMLAIAKRSAALLAGTFAALFLAALYFAILRPSGSHFPDVIPYANTRFWTLSTGSVLAYSEFDPPAGMQVKPEAIVYLHGGPGVRQGPFDQEIYGSLAAAGFRVFLFDQAGSGLSAFLPHLRDYTIARSVDDLEGVRQQIGVDKMILIGHSWGSTLAALYMAKYPGHVAKVVFHSPGAIWHVEQALSSVDYSRTAAGKFSLPAPRLLAALLLRERNPDAAENLVPQKEAEMLVVPSFRKTLGTVVCKGDLSKLPPDLIAATAGSENPGVNPYVLQELIPATEDPGGDPHVALRANRTPAILLYPECNYLPWADVVDYRHTFSNLRVYYIPRAGHYIQFEQPELLKSVILAFLLNQPDPIPAHSGDTDPRISR